MAETNAQLVRRGFEAARSGDLDLLADLLAEDVKWHGGDGATGCQNRGQAFEFLRQAGARLPDMELLDVVPAGDRVVVILRPPPLGPQPAAPIANLTTFRDGKVVEMVHYANPGDALAAAGALRSL